MRQWLFFLDWEIKIINLEDFIMIDFIIWLDSTGIAYALFYFGAIALWIITERQHDQIKALKKQRDTFKSWLILERDRKSTRLNSSHIPLSRMPSSA